MYSVPAETFKMKLSNGSIFIVSQEFFFTRTLSQFQSLPNYLQRVTIGYTSQTLWLNFLASGYDVFPDVTIAMYLLGIKKRTRGDERCTKLRNRCTYYRKFITFSFQSLLFAMLWPLCAVLVLVGYLCQQRCSINTFSKSICS